MDIYQHQNGKSFFQRGAVDSPLRKRLVFVITCAGRNSSAKHATAPMFWSPFTIIAVASFLFKEGSTLEHHNYLLLALAKFQAQRMRLVPCFAALPISPCFVTEPRLTHSSTTHPPIHPPFH